jgi:hypothetical protein
MVAHTGQVMLQRSMQAERVSVGKRSSLHSYLRRACISGTGLKVACCSVPRSTKVAFCREQSDTSQ